MKRFCDLPRFDVFHWYFLNASLYVPNELFWLH